MTTSFRKNYGEDFKFVIIVMTHEGDVFCEGIFNGYEEALGSVMHEILNYQSDWLSEEGNSFNIDSITPCDDDGWGCVFTLSLKKADWPKSIKEKYMVVPRKHKVCGCPRLYTSYEETKGGKNS